jgi:sugar phosphate isomerase/epimerase
MAERISIVTDEISQDLWECESFLQEHRVGAVELRMVGGHRIPFIAPREIDILKSWVRKEEPLILGLSPGLFKCPADPPAEIQKQLDETLPRTLDLARQLRARFVITFGFLENGPEEVPEHALNGLRLAAELCRKSDLPLLLENEPGTYARTASQSLALLMKVNHPNLHLNWDPCNTNEFESEKLYQALCSIHTHVRHVHVKNGRLLPGQSHATCGPLRKGAIDWGLHLALLKELGYRGHLGVETHFRPLRESSARVLSELREMAEEVEFWG